MAYSDGSELTASSSFVTPIFVDFSDELDAGKKAQTNQFLRSPAFKTRPFGTGVCCQTAQKHVWWSGTLFHRQVIMRQCSAGTGTTLLLLGYV